MLLAAAENVVKYGVQSVAFEVCHHLHNTEFKLKLRSYHTGPTATRTWYLSLS